MRDKEVAKQVDLEQHAEQDWKFAHNIWPRVKEKIPYFTETPSVSYVPTVDGAWHELAVSGAPAGCIVIAVLSVYWQGDADADWFYFYTRKKGSTAAYEGVAIGAGRHGSMIFQLVDTDNKYEYKSVVVSAASYLITQVGYMVFPK